MLRLLTLLLLVSPTFAADLDRERLRPLDAIVNAAIARGDCPGAVLAIIHNDAVVLRQAYGQRTKPDVPMTADTIFDMASLTKPIATGTSIAILIERGQLRPADLVSKYWPEFAANGKDAVTVEHCLLHTSGLTADNAIGDYKDGRAEAMKRVAALKLEVPPGTRFRYSDVGFIVLGELVHKISGQPVDQFAKANVFTPLKLNDTGYKPAASLRPRIAPSGLRDKQMIVGEVHDPRAFAMDGVAGHAGLFSSVDDLIRYSRMLLNGGELDGVRVLSPLTVQKFTEPHAVPGGLRSYGWDVDTSFSAPRGELFPAGESFGHTGFTGTSLWIDPPSRTAIILLTNRLHPNEKGNVTELRRQVATIVASALPNRSVGQRSSLPKSAVLPGLDVLRRDGFAQLKGRKIGLVTNHTGKAIDGTSTIDLLAKAEGVKLVTLFSPEHGIRGEKDEKVGDSKDDKTGLPIYSLYGEIRKPTAAMLKDVDTLVYDIQDIGCRFYTYASTLGLILEAAKEHNLRVVVLDRPNPIGGTIIEGPIRDPNRSSFVGYHDIPLRHGLTVGELATLYNVDKQWNVDLQIIKCEGWRRGDTWDRTGLPWRNPSPNMRHLTAAMLYPGVGILETTNVSVGRGTERPFEWIGAPWLNAIEFAKAMNAQRLPGVRFLPTSRTPTYSTHKNVECQGVDIIVDDWLKLRAVPVGLALAKTLHERHPNDWKPTRLDVLLLHAETAKAVLSKTKLSEIVTSWEKDQNVFRSRREKVLLYSE